MGGFVFFFCKWQLKEIYWEEGVGEIGEKKVYSVVDIVKVWFFFYILIVVIIIWSFFVFKVFF